MKIDILTPFILFNGIMFTIVGCFMAYSNVFETLLLPIFVTMLGAISIICYHHYSQKTRKVKA